MIVNSPSIPAKPASAGVYDTRAYYKIEKVSFGNSCYCEHIYDGISYPFFDDNKLTGYASLQEDNLICCVFLNLLNSSIVRFEAR